MALSPIVALPLLAVTRFGIVATHPCRPFGKPRTTSARATVATPRPACAMIPAHRIKCLKARGRIPSVLTSIARGRKGVFEVKRDSHFFAPLLPKGDRVGFRADHAVIRFGSHRQRGELQPRR